MPMITRVLTESSGLTLVAKGGTIATSGKLVKVDRLGGSVSMSLRIHRKVNSLDFYWLNRSKSLIKTPLGGLG